MYIFGELLDILTPIKQIVHAHTTCNRLNTQLKCHEQKSEWLQIVLCVSTS